MNGHPYLVRGLSLTAIAAWVGYWLVKARYSLLDDALIHLHYADFLHRLHFITFDGVHHTFGTSSLLYVSLLALLRGVTTSALLPKTVADVFYVMLLAVLIYRIWKCYALPRAQMALIGLLLCLLSPMGVRWLTDGMETGLTNLTVVLLAIVLNAELGKRNVTLLRYLLLAAFGAGIVFLRIELSMLVALCCLSLVAAKLEKGKKLAAAVVDASPLAVGALAAMLTIRLVMGHLLPDTALAKSVGHFTLDPLRASVQVMGSSLLFGAGACLCWLFSLLVVLNSSRRPRTRGQWVGFLAENAAIFVIFGLACLRGQVVQGVRYFVWAFVFGVAANALRMARFEGARASDDRLSGVDRAIATVFCIVFVCALPLDWRWAVRAMNGRSQTFLEMRDSELSELFRDQPIVAADVGFITYFTDARTCDTEGLVNGRVAAAQTREQRAEACAKQNPVMIFATRASFELMREAMDTDGWQVCAIYDFTNVRGNDRHYVVVPAASAPRVCGALGFRAMPVSVVENAAE